MLLTWLQVQQSSDNDFKTWTRWGRVGEQGQSAYLGNGALKNAVHHFEGKFKGKSGLGWTDREREPRPGKYAFIERNYSSNDDRDNKTDKLPLGRPSEVTITRASQALKNLSSLLDDPELAGSYGMTYDDATVKFSNVYYTFIPHAFGRKPPTIIRSRELLEKQMKLLKSLEDNTNAARIKKPDAHKTEQVNLLDRQFQELGLKPTQNGRIIQHRTSSKRRTSALKKRTRRERLNLRGKQNKDVSRQEIRPRCRRH